MGYISGCLTGYLRDNLQDNLRDTLQDSLQDTLLDTLRDTLRDTLQIDKGNFHTAAFNMLRMLFCMSSIRAEIQYSLGGINEAVANYTRVIQLTPSDYIVYFRRAELFEQVSICMFTLRHLSLVCTTLNT